MKRFFLTAALIVAAFLVSGTGLEAMDQAWKAREGEFAVASVFTDHMVLQQESQAPVWGWANKGTKVTVSTSWDRKKYSATAGDDGRWEVKVSTPQAGGPYTVTVTARKEKVVLEDVMVGEVWLCTGQSNMQQFVTGFDGQGVEGALEALLDAPQYRSCIRVFNMLTDKAYEPMDMVPSEWKYTDPTVVYRTSAVAYHFAKQLTKTLGVTVGIITCPWGGSRIEPWMNEEYLRKSVEGKIPDERLKVILARREKENNAPVQVGTMYNARMYPVKGYALKGFIWYQGCANRGDITYYDKMQAGMVECWRQMWGDTEGSLSFYFATIAPYSYGDSANPLRAFFVENQLNSLDLIPNSGAAVTETLGDEGCIHPAKKIPVAMQFALLALERDYGVESGAGHGFPYPSRIVFPANSTVQPGTVRQSGFEIGIEKGEAADQKIVVHIANACRGVGHITEGHGNVTGFEVAGSDRVFRPVEAWTRGGRIELDCTGIADPQAVRYSFHNYCESNLVSALGVPVPPFRTDKWAE